jgi:hypothetical protein
MAIGAFVNTKVPPSACTVCAVFHAIEFASSAPKIIPLFPFNKLYPMLVDSIVRFNIQRYLKYVNSELK